MSIYDLSEHLGHTSVKTTEIYLDFLTPAEAKQAKDGMAQNPAQPRRFPKLEPEVSHRNIV
jgi:integrase/recombinase XerD